jgi:hypothetical protein
MVKNQLNHERDIEEILKNSEAALEDKNTSKSQLLNLLNVLEIIGNDSKYRDGEEWEIKALRNKGIKIGGMLKKLKVRIAEFEFDEYIEKIGEENDLSALSKLEDK